MEALGDDVQVTVRRYYIAFRRIRNFACVEIHPQTRNILVYLKSDFSNIVFEPGFSRDTRTIGHFGTGDLEITIHSDHDLERAQSFIQQSYNLS